MEKHDLENREIARLEKTDYLIVGAGLYGAILARKAADAGKSVRVIEKRSHIAGNIYTREDHGIQVHQYGAHIFHTSNEEVWNFLNQYTSFNRFTNTPVANYHGEMYSLPFNMFTYNRMWNVQTPQQAMDIIEQQRKEITGEPENLEEQAISLVGRDIYEKLVKGYTEKQWGRPCNRLPAFIIKRLPVRMTWDNNYFNDKYQGIPEQGYTELVRRLLEGIEVRLETDYLEHKDAWNESTDRVIYTGCIDAYYDYCYGPLEYRSLRFEEELLDTDNFQGNAAVNYTDRETPWTRIIEHKWFLNPDSKQTIITREYPSDWKPGEEPYYPLNDEKNSALLQLYQQLAVSEPKIRFGGRLGEYRYYDMDKVAAAALQAAREEGLE